MPRLSAIAVLLVWVVLIGGCTAESTPGQAGPDEPSQPASTTVARRNQPSPADPSDPSKPCALLPGETVARSLGVSAVTATPLPRQTDAESEAYICDYSTDDGAPLATMSITVFKNNLIDAPTMIDSVTGKFTAPADVTGIGEAAATFEDENARYLAAAKIVADTPMMVMLIGLKDTTVEQLTGLAGPVIDQL